ncbi:hypothetical protein [Halobacteriaceae bacterium SHR40]|uniref:hypothetical protein n=1 Tax=Halovenus amylolytica TaxID=2500550 RepID=UPI000FE2C6C6
MLERFGIDQDDLRNMGVVVVVMTLIMTFLIDAPIVARLIVASIMGLTSATAFLVVTVLINKFGPESY